MAADERDDTDEWLLPADGGPPTLYELEQRVEVALAVARGAETAALEIGAASVEAAQEARRAAELAQRASLAAELAQRAGPAAAAEPAPGDVFAVPDAEPEPELDPFQERLLAFRERAERVSVRLQRLDRAAPISSS